MTQHLCDLIYFLLPIILSILAPSVFLKNHKPIPFPRHLHLTFFLPVTFFSMYLYSSCPHFFFQVSAQLLVLWKVFIDCSIEHSSALFSAPSFLSFFWQHICASNFLCSLLLLTHYLISFSSSVTLEADLMDCLTQVSLLRGYLIGIGHWEHSRR